MNTDFTGSLNMQEGKTLSLGCHNHDKYIVASVSLCLKVIINTFMQHMNHYYYIMVQDESAKHFIWLVVFESQKTFMNECVQSW